MSNKIKKIYHAAIYVRLSKEDDKDIEFSGLFATSLTQVKY